MLTRTIRHFAIIFFAVLLWQSPAHASEKTRLTKINQHIQRIQSDLKQAAIKKINLQKALKKTEVAESHLTQALEKTHHSLSHQRKLLNHLDHEAMVLRDRLDTNKAALKKQIRTAFLLSRQPTVKYFLDANSIQQYQRTFVYFQYVTNAQAQIIKTLQQTLSAYEANKKNRQIVVHKLQQTQQQQMHNKHTLQQTLQTRHQLIHTINQSISTKRQKLSQLQQDKQRLEKTLRELNQQTLNKNLFKQPFAKLRGLLPWPTLGVIKHYFGTQISQSELRWSGTLIEAATGTPVRAIAAGKVIFAKWLQGYGLLIIIDHGDGYMSLYGRNQSLLKKVGDWVKPNDTIATVGQSGGFEKSALYFSIRHNAKPLNPEQWCRKQVKHA